VNDSCVCHMQAMLSGEELCMVASSFSFHEQEERGESAWRFLLSVMTMWSLRLTAFKHTQGMNIKVLCIEHILTNLG
jgi:hypothetical protein